LVTLHQLVPDETRVPALLRTTPNSLKSKPHSLNMTRMPEFVAGGAKATLMAVP